jgi:hypothetical protein
MSIETILQDHRIEFHLIGNDLKCRASHGAVTPEIRQAIAEHREEIIHHVRRQTTRDRLLQLYTDQAARYTGDDYRRAASVPGWAAELERLESAFTSAWEAGGDPAAELEALAEHWRVGLAEIRTEARA